LRSALPQFGRLFHPVSLVRHVRKISGGPRIVVRLRPPSITAATVRR
jgi:hypothetical protein